MKIILSILFTFLFTASYSQVQSFDSLMYLGKAEFQKPFEEQDYSKAEEYFSKAVKMEPRNAEAHYYLGYVYSRLNSKDGRSMIDMSLPLTIMTSEEFETVNKLTPKYTGELVVLDPYSKLSAEWGSMAMSYWHNNKKDSAAWAFREGKRRGGFGDYILSINRRVLDLCERNAILVSSGDNFSIVLWYLQIAEGYRTDVAVVDVSLLNTEWYPGYLSDNNIVKFDLSKADLDTIEYCTWRDSLVTIGNFSWIVQPGYYGQYLLRGDRIFLGLLRKNNFERGIYFTTGFMEESRLSLRDYLIPMVLVDKVNVKDEAAKSNDFFKDEFRKILSLTGKINTNSRGDLWMLDHVRMDLLYRMSVEISKGNKKEAKALLGVMNKYASLKKYPIQTDNGKRYADEVLKQLDQ